MTNGRPRCCSLYGLSSRCLVQYADQIGHHICKISSTHTVTLAHTLRDPDPPVGRNTHCEKQIKTICYQQAPQPTAHIFPRTPFHQQNTSYISTQKKLIDPQHWHFGQNSTLKHHTSLTITCTQNAHVKTHVTNQITMKSEESGVRFGLWCAQQWREIEEGMLQEEVFDKRRKEKRSSRKMSQMRKRRRRERCRRTQRTRSPFLSALQRGVGKCIL